MGGALFCAAMGTKKPMEKNVYTKWNSEVGPTIVPLTRGKSAVVAVGNLDEYELPARVRQAVKGYPYLHYELIRLAWRDEEAFFQLWKTNPSLLFLVANWVSRKAHIWEEDEGVAMLRWKWSRLAGIFEIPGMARVLAKAGATMPANWWHGLFSRKRRKFFFRGRRGRRLQHLRYKLTGNGFLVANMPLRYWNSSILEAATRCPIDSVYRSLCQIRKLQNRLGCRRDGWTWGNHVRWAADVCDREAELRERLMATEVKPFPKGPVEDSNTFKAVKSPAELHLVGEEWGNCASRYRTMMERSLATLYVCGNPEDGYLVMLIRAARVWVVEQAVQAKNVPTTREQEGEIAAWVKANGIADNRGDAEDPWCGF